MATPRRDPTTQTGSRMAGNKNGGKRLANETPGPWLRWPETDRAERAIRFIETYCRSPKGYGAGEPLVLAEFQRDWIRRSLADGVSVSVMSVGRGNGKSTLLAALGLWALFDPGPGGAPQIPVVATTVQQAVTSVYGVALAMIRAEWELESRCFIYSAIGAQRIVAPQNGGEMFPRSNDPDGLQGLDMSLAIVDEIGFMPIDSWTSILLASGKRPSSLVVGIGTPGFERANALWDIRERTRTGTDLPGFVYTEYAADVGCDIHDRDQWRLANPALDEGYMNIGALETAVVLSPESQFRIFRLGQWQDGVACWLGEDGAKVWGACEAPYDLVEGAPTWVGVDVALRHDSTAVVVCQQRDDGRWHVAAQIWHPTEDGRLDVADVMGYIRRLGGLFDLREVAYDPRFFDLPAQTLLEEGYPMVEIPQNVARMTPAVGATYEAIKRQEITHDGVVGFSSQVLNAVARLNESGFTLAKGKSRGKIDAAVAMCLAFHRAQGRQTTSAPEVWAAYG